MEKELFDDLMQGLEEMVAFENGELTEGVDTHVIKPRFRDKNIEIFPINEGGGEITSLRYELKLSQADFAKVFGVSKAAVSSWEQGLRKPSGTVKRLMTLLENDPERIKELAEV